MGEKKAALSVVDPVNAIGGIIHLLLPERREEICNKFLNITQGEPSNTIKNCDLGGRQEAMV